MTGNGFHQNVSRYCIKCSKNNFCKISCLPAPVTPVFNMFKETRFNQDRYDVVIYTTGNTSLHTGSGLVFSGKSGGKYMRGHFCDFNTLNEVLNIDDFMKIRCSIFCALRLMLTYNRPKVNLLQ